MIRLFVCLLFLSSSLSAQTILHGTAVRIADGDTFTLLSDHQTQTRVRLHGIDAPERGQDFNKVATAFLKAQLQPGNIKVLVKDTDRYGRIVGQVWINDTTDVNLALLKAGLAWHYKRYDRNVLYIQAEQEAKKLKLGLWSLPRAIAPWEFRKVKRVK